MRNQDFYFECMKKVISTHNLLQEVDELYNAEVMTNQRLLEAIVRNANLKIFLPLSSGQKWTFNGKIFIDDDNGFNLTLDKALNSVSNIKLLS